MFRGEQKIDMEVGTTDKTDWDKPGKGNRTSRTYRKRQE